MFLKSSLIVSISALAFAQAAQAQEAPEQGLEEIIVTAQKREQNMQDVAVAVTALSGEALTNRNVATVGDLPRLAPSLTLTQGNVPTNNSINLRGIGTVSFSTAIEPSVAVIVDDVPLLQQAQAFSGLSDIARIEVLRGPQGTLFGKNASAGAINIVSKGASDVFTGAVTGTATTDDQYRVDASLAGPLGESAGFRINGFYNDRKGYIRNLQDGSRLNNDKSYGVRGRLELKPAEGLKLDVTASHTVSESDGFARTYRAVPAGAAVFGTPVAASIVGVTPGEDNFNVRLDHPLFNKSRQTTVSGRATLDLGFADLVSVTSYQDWKFRFEEDFDYTISNVLGIPGGIVANSSYAATQFTQEVRLVSPTKSAFSYVVGLFYADGKTDRSFARGPSGPVVANWTSRSQTQSYAAFAQATYDLADTTHLDVGARLNHEEISVRFLNNAPNANPPANNATCLSLCTGADKDTVVTWKTSLRQDLSDQVMVYASFARGYKGQGFDISTGFKPSRAANPVRPETSDAYEAGIKSRFFDNKVQLNLSAFWSNFRDFQAQSGVVLPDNTIELTLNNVGRVRTRGFELELSARPIPTLTIDSALSFTDTRIMSFPGAQCYSGQTTGCVDLDGAGPSTVKGQDLAGKRLPNAPRLKFNVGGTYDILLPSLPFDGFVQADVAYQSAVNFDLLSNPLTVQKGYAVVNGSIGIDQNDRGGLRVALFVNNLFDKRYATNISVAPGGSVGLLHQALDRNSRRYFGIRARYEF
ncbi:TonB-dependent receptor [Novosphingobium jiangmenense]|uniref:TonB-dependent receptor n=1 Tax=Novosphingobium jiangmenense TaxID=2791981 RepID=UPI0031B6184B